MQDNAAKEPSATMLYVSNLPFSFVDDDLKKIFAGFDVSSAYVATRRNGRSKGFGFVTFSSTDQQKKALDSFDGKELNGRTLTVRVAHKDDRRDAKGELKEEFKGAQESQPRRKRGANKEGGADRKEGGNGGAAAGGADKKPSDTILYVSNLPFEFTDADLTNVFKAHNPVSARIARRRNERSKGFGFVEFANHKDQQAALALDNHKVGDREISVKVSVAGDAAQKEKSENNNNNAGGNKKNDEKRGGNKGGDAGSRGGGAASGPSDTTLYVSNLPFDLTDAALGEVFRSRGHNPSNARIARRRDDRSKGFGFVEFANAAAQKAALAAVEKEGVTLGDRQISVKVAMKDSETRAAGDKDAAAAAPKGGKGKGGGAKKEENNNNNNNNDGNEGGDGKRRRQRRRAGTGGAGGAGAANGDRPAADNKPRAEKKDSETLVYVSNLSFDVDDNVLAKLFDGLTIKSAHVAVRRNGRSKGFGFVEFASHADQQKALQRTGVELHGRKLTVEVAKENVENK